MRLRTRSLALITLAIVAGAALPACPRRGSPRADAPASRRASSTTAPASVPLPPTTVPIPNAACGGGPYPPPWPERPRYRVEATLDPGARTLTGIEDVAFTPDSSTDHAVLRLWANGVLPARTGGRIDLRGATMDGRSVDVAFAPGGAPLSTPGTIATLPFGEARSAGSAVALHVDFALHLPGSNPDRIATVGSNIRLGSALPVLSWVRGDGWQVSPAVDLLAESAASEVADWDVTVHAPDGLVVLATGDEVTPRHFVASAVRDFALSAGDMRTATALAQGGRTTVVAGVGAGVGDDPKAIADLAAHSIDEMAARFGPYPYDHLSVAVSPGLRGGIEFPMHIQVGARLDPRHLVHEVGHQWFYGLVGNDQFRDPWLDEGLTNYAEGRVDERLAAYRALPIAPAGAGRTGSSMAYWLAHSDIYFRSVYVQGTQALAAVADAVGGYAKLDCGLAHYVRDQAYRVARPADLFAAIEAETGIAPARLREVLAPYGLGS